MQDLKKIKTALISIFHKEGLEKIVALLIDNVNVKVVNLQNTYEAAEKDELEQNYSVAV